MESTFAQTASTVLVNLGLAWIVGVLAARCWLTTSAAPWQQPVRQRLSTAMPAGLLACIAAIFLSLWTESAAMGNVAWLDAGPACAAMLTSTHYGHAGIAAIALLALALFTHWCWQEPRNESRYLAVILVLVFLVAATRVSIGHAYEYGPLSIAVAVEWLHVMLMSLWAGAVFVAGWLVLPCMLRREPGTSPERARYLKLLSAWATVAMAGILATGIGNSYRVLGSARDLVDAEYGQVLLLKLAFVGTAIALGGWNRYFGVPAAQSQTEATARRGLRTVIAILRLESFFLLLVLVAAAMLTGSAPPGAV